MKTTILNWIKKHFGIRLEWQPKPFDPNADLRRRIELAKEKVIVNYSPYSPSGLEIKNYKEILDILEYEDTLGMALFIRDMIGRKVDTDKCIKYLTR